MNELSPVQGHVICLVIMAAKKVQKGIGFLSDIRALPKSTRITIGIRFSLVVECARFLCVGNVSHLLRWYVKSFAFLVRSHMSIVYTCVERMYFMMGATDPAMEPDRMRPVASGFFLRY